MLKSPQHQNVSINVNGYPTADKDLQGEDRVPKETKVKIGNQQVMLKTTEGGNQGVSFLELVLCVSSRLSSNPLLRKAK